MIAKPPGWPFLVALATDAPFMPRFSLSAPSLGAYAEKIMEQSPIPYESCEWAGLYRVCGGRVDHSASDDVLVPGSAGFMTTEWAIYGNTGFSWHPGVVPQETADDTYRHLVGNWYGYHGWDQW
jgi:hypothetical protein